MNILKVSVLGGALALTAACTTPFKADVSRFQNLPAPAGETFAIVPEEQEDANSLEFENYARYVAQELREEGYNQVAAPSQATLIVSLDYGIGDPREKLASRPSTRLGFGYGYPWAGYYGYGYRHPIFYDPFFYGYGGLRDSDVYSYTVYPTFLEMDIRRPDGEPVFEGRAVTTTRDNNLPEIVPNLVEAMFTDFPGMSGRTVTVKVPRDRD